MKAPEKIFVSTDQFGFLHAYDSESHPPIVEEYVRKDAFIEKAVEYIANNMGCDGYTLQTKAKFIRGFRSLMNGKNE